MNYNNLINQIKELSDNAEKRGLNDISNNLHNINGLCDAYELTGDVKIIEKITEKLIEVVTSLMDKSNGKELVSRSETSDIKVLKSFRNYLIESGIKETTAYCYSSALKIIVEQKNLNNIIDLNNNIDELIVEFENNREEREKDHNQKSNALKKYREFIK